MRAPSFVPSHPPPRHRAPWRGDPSRDREREGFDLGRLLIGLTVLALGVLFLIDATGGLDAGSVISDWWPVVLVAAGVLTLAERPPAVVRGTILTAAGLVLLAFTTNVLHENAWSYVWPALVIAVGLLIVARWRGRAVAQPAGDEDVVRSTAVFGGPSLVCTSQRFRGAWLTAIFGGITLDLRHAVPAPEGASINATVAFGGVDILVPPGWRISVRTTPIFGGVDDKTGHDEPPAATAPVLHVDALTLFGGVAIKHEK